MAGISPCVDLTDQAELPSMGSDVGPEPYHENLRHLLRVGDLWDIQPGGAFDRLLLALAAELARTHHHLGKLAEDAPYVVSPLHDWRLETYEKLLAAYGIDAVVSDHELNPPTMDNVSVDGWLWHPANQFFIIITVPRLDAIPDDHPVHTCLQNYKQSHTDFMWREHPRWVVDYDAERTTIDNISLNGTLYERCFHGISIYSHPSFKRHEMYQYFTAPLPVKETHDCNQGSVRADVRYDIRQTTLDNISLDSVLYEQDWHALDIYAYSSYGRAAVESHASLLGIRPYTQYFLNPAPTNLANSPVDVSSAQTNDSMKKFTSKIKYHWERLPYASN